MVTAFVILYLIDIALIQAIKKHNPGTQNKYYRLHAASHPIAVNLIKGLFIGYYIFQCLREEKYHVYDVLLTLLVYFAVVISLLPGLMRSDGGFKE